LPSAEAVARPQSEKFNVCNRADIHAYFGDATRTRGVAAIRWNGERKNQ
jgi:hypothetical protein